MKNKAPKTAATMTSGSVKPRLEVFWLICMRRFINSMEIISTCGASGGVYEQTANSLSKVHLRIGRASTAFN
jgi:hypothetical protein